MGHSELAFLYRDFYVSSWQYFLSGYADSESSREALTYGYDFLRLYGKIVSNS